MICRLLWMIWIYLQTYQVNILKYNYNQTLERREKNSHFSVIDYVLSVITIYQNFLKILVIARFFKRKCKCKIARGFLNRQLSKNHGQN